MPLSDKIVFSPRKFESIDDELMVRSSFGKFCVHESFVKFWQRKAAAFCTYETLFFLFDGLEIVSQKHVFLAVFSCDRLNYIQ